jgi:hypothetical protein
MTSPAFAASIVRRRDEQPSAWQSRAGVPRETRLLALPNRLDESVLGPGVVQVSRTECPDVVFLAQPNAAYLIANSLPAGPAAILPVVDASLDVGHLSAENHRADLKVAAPNRSGVVDALAMLAPTIERVRLLPPSVLYSDDVRIILLARLMVRARGIKPRRDPNARETFVYDDDNAVAGTARYAHELVTLGLLQRCFFDMLTVCPRCESGRVCVRERCPACASTHLLEEPIFHHLRCAYQAPEHEFRSGSSFVCPKCRAPLLHFSVDYDRPGSVSVCRACGNASSETSVGLVCLDCGTESDAAEMGTKEIYGFELTEAAQQCILNGAPLPARNARFDGAANRIRNFVSRQKAAHEPFCILAAEIEAPAGKPLSRSFQQTCSFFSSLMHETFTPETEIIDMVPWFFALLANDSKVDVESALPEIRSELERFLSERPAIRYRVYDRNDVELIFGGATWSRRETT